MAEHVAVAAARLVVACAGCEGEPKRWVSLKGCGSPRWVVAAVIDAPDLCAAALAALAALAPATVAGRRAGEAGALAGVALPSEPPVPAEARATAGVEPAVTATAVARATALWRARTVVDAAPSGCGWSSWVRAASWSG